MSPIDPVETYDGRSDIWTKFNFSCSNKTFSADLGAAPAPGERNINNLDQRLRAAPAKEPQSLENSKRHDAKTTASRLEQRDNKEQLKRLAEERKNREKLKKAEEKAERKQRKLHLGGMVWGFDPTAGLQRSDGPSHQQCQRGNGHNAGQMAGEGLNRAAWEEGSLERPSRGNTWGIESGRPSSRAALENCGSDRSPENGCVS